MASAPRSALENDENRWVGAEGEWDGYPAIIRFRPALTERVDCDRLDRRLTVEWTYEHDGGSGMPTPEESDRMAEFENAIVPALECDVSAALAVVITHNGQRRWTLYFSDADLIQERINLARADARNRSGAVRPAPRPRAAPLDPQRASTALRAARRDFGDLRVLFA